MDGFIYLIGWTAHDKWYIGSRYAKGCTPADLWDTYFTSCDKVQRHAMIYGKPDVMKILFEGDDPLQIRALEREEIAKANAITDSRYFNQNGGRLTEHETKFIKGKMGAERATDLAKRFGVSRIAIYNIWNKTA